MKPLSLITLLATITILTGCTTTSNHASSTLQPEDLLGSWAAKSWKRGHSFAQKITFHEDFTCETTSYHNDVPGKTTPGKWELKGYELFLTEGVRGKEITSPPFQIEDFNGSEFDLILLRRPGAFQSRFPSNTDQRMDHTGVQSFRTDPTVEREIKRWHYRKVASDFSFEEITI